MGAITCNQYVIIESQDKGSDVKHDKTHGSRMLWDANYWNAGLFLGCGVSIQSSESSPPGREVAGKLALAFALLVDRGTVSRGNESPLEGKRQLKGNLAGS